MTKGLCPKCGATDVRTGPDLAKKGFRGGLSYIPITFWSYALLDHYVCLTCGYVESYVGEESKLPKIGDKWRKVSPR